MFTFERTVSSHRNSTLMDLLFLQEPEGVCSTVCHLHCFWRVAVCPSFFLCPLRAFPIHSSQSVIFIVVLSHFSHVWLFETPWTVARQAPLSMGVSRQEHWSGLHALPQGIFLIFPQIEPSSFTSAALAGGFFASSAAWEACPSSLGLRNILCFRAVFLIFLVFEVCWASWTPWVYGLRQFWKRLAIISSCVFLSPLFHPGLSQGSSDRWISPTSPGWSPLFHFRQFLLPRCQANLPSFLLRCLLYY